MNKLSLPRFPSGALAVVGENLDIFGLFSGFLQKLLNEAFNQKVHYYRKCSAWNSASIKCRYFEFWSSGLVETQRRKCQFFALLRENSFHHYKTYSIYETTNLSAKRYRMKVVEHQILLSERPRKSHKPFLDNKISRFELYRTTNRF